MNRLRVASWVWLALGGSVGGPGLGSGGSGGTLGGGQAGSLGGPATWALSEDREGTSSKTSAGTTTVQLRTGPLEGNVLLGCSSALVVTTDGKLPGADDGVWRKMTVMRTERTPRVASRNRRVRVNLFLDLLGSDWARER